MADYKARRKDVFKEMMSRTGAGAEAGAESAALEAVQRLGLGEGISDPATEIAPFAPAAEESKQQGVMAEAGNREVHPGNALQEEVEPSTLRQRRGVHVSEAGGDLEDHALCVDDTKEDESLALPPKVLNVILAVAAVLGGICLLVCIMVYVYGGQSRSEPG
mmetsp:Transcript_38925/g.121181  ORF Transcript_38925/g.121181 Transcript_38925/m.121181 type:complete len:162 (-) Transcript_38925:96-581(-)